MINVGYLVQRCLHEAEKRFTISEVAADWHRLSALALFFLKMHKNAFDGRAPPEPSGELTALLQTS